MARPDIVTEIPGPKSLALAERLRRHESRNVTYLAPDWPVFWERASGTNVWDVDGNQYLDLTSAFGVCGLGHGNPAVRTALIEQADRLSHAMGDVHPTELKANLCARLSALTFERWGAGAGKVILGNSGFEAVEAALKTSLLATGKPGVLAFRGSYHGLGLGALATTELAYFREPFRAALKEFAAFVPFPSKDADLVATEQEMQVVLERGDIGCVLVEPIQGRGGCVVPSPEFLPRLREICTEYGALLVLDEIYTGFNRTGALFACDHWHVVPDLICLGKGLTNGFPLSACVGTASLMDAWPLSKGEALHTSTYLGHPLGCAMALAALGLHGGSATAEMVQSRGFQLEDALRSIDSDAIADVRGKGLMLGVELIDAAGKPATQLAVGIMKRALQSGILLLADSPTSNVLSFSPPFSISDDEIGFVTEWLARELGDLRNDQRYEIWDPVTG